jgi:hypothetical protein
MILNAQWNIEMSIWMVFVVAGLLIVLNSTAFGMLAWDEWCSQTKGAAFQKLACCLRP